MSDLGILSPLISLCSLLISVYVLFRPYISLVQIELQPERQVQVSKGKTVNLRTGEVPVFVFNVLCTIVATGSEKRWDTLKVEQAIITYPSGRTSYFPCQSYLDEAGISQKPRSRSVPIAMQGGDAQAVTASFISSDEKDCWVPGHYKVVIEAGTSIGKRIRTKSIEYDLTPELLSNLDLAKVTHVIPAILV